MFPENKFIILSSVIESFTVLEKKILLGLSHYHPLIFIWICNHSVEFVSCVDRVHLAHNTFIRKRWVCIRCIELTTCIQFHSFYLQVQIFHKNIKEHRSWEAALRYSSLHHLHSEKVSPIFTCCILQFK